MSGRSFRPVRLLVVVAGAVVVGLFLQGYLRARVFAPRPPDDAALGVTVAAAGNALTEFARDLEAPWDVGFLPEGGVVVTERPGRLVGLDARGSRIWSTPVAGVRARGEGGLLGLALHPSFAENRWIYVYFTADGENRIERYALSEAGALTDRRVILGGIPAAAFHDGGRIAFGPDGLLYVTTGDAGDGGLAQDPGSLAGKILRVTDAGGVPEGNPWGTVVWTLGHRNPQGLAWDDHGTLWSTEHGRSGVRTGMDEVNRIEGGGNYGWPNLEGDDVGAGFVAPALHSGPDHTWAPAGAAWLGGSLWFGGLRGQSLYQVELRGAAPELVVHFHAELGRVRAVRVGPGGLLWILTSNTDGRASPRPGDDRLLRLDPGALPEGR